MRALLVFSAVLLVGLVLGAGDPDCKNGGVSKDETTCDCQPYWSGKDCGTKVSVIST